MTLKFDNVYVLNSATVSGPVEANGPLRESFDKVYNDYYMDKKSVELSEVKMQKDAINILLDKEKIIKDNIDIFIGGDLTNQIASSCYAFSDYKAPFLGLYTACATSIEGLIIGSSFLESKLAKNIICTTSSHNLVAEKQFRNPIEYGALKPSIATFTATGGASILLSRKKSDIKITSATIGRIINLHQTDVNHMGAVMAPACADTLVRHLNNTNTTLDDYDLVLSGDLGIYGAEILKDIMARKYNILVSRKYNDCGLMLYDIERQKEVMAGGSGPVCSALVNYGYILDMLKKKNLKKVLLIATGALFNPTMVFQKQDILGIANAVCLEVVE